MPGMTGIEIKSNRDQINAAHRELANDGGENTAQTGIEIESHRDRISGWAEPRNSNSTPIAELSM